MNTIAIIVTFNRRLLLENCIAAINAQTEKPTNILIVDNASSDDTMRWFDNSAHKEDPRFLYLRLSTNTGGAGGFRAGLDFFEKGAYDWAWIMDDDALPYHDAFEKLMSIRPNPVNIYGSIAINGNSTSWKTTLIRNNGSITTDKLEDIPDAGKVTFLPFLGLLIHKSTIDKIGLPDSDFFIAGDDLEYCLRARQAGIDIVAIGKSKISHPKANVRSLHIFGFTLDMLIAPPWKTYYNTRNKILISKKYYGIKLVTKTVPGILLRLAIHLLFESNKLSNLYAVTAGLFDGLLGIKGKRHSFWKINQ